MATASQPPIRIGPRRRPGGHRHGHGHPVVAGGVDRPAGQRPAAAARRRPARRGGGSASAPMAPQGGDHGGDAVALFDLELGGVGEGGGPLGARPRPRPAPGSRRSATGPRRRPPRWPAAAVAGDDGGGVGAPGRGPTSSMSAPMRRSTSRKPARPGPDVDVLDGQVAARGDAGGHDPEGGLGGVARARPGRTARSASGRTVTAPGDGSMSAPHERQQLLGVHAGSARPPAPSSPRRRPGRPAARAPLTWALGTGSR